MKPFVKWAGGKRQILKRINEFIDDSVERDASYTYIEPFLGGGAVFFDKAPSKAIINDLNADLMNAYRVIQSDQYLELIELLNQHAADYRERADEHYYAVRAWDRESGWPDNHTPVERAARMIFLNKTCYNGLYRVNSNGQFNTPIGRYHNPLICDRDTITEIHNYLSSNDNQIKIMNGNYKDAIDLARDGDVIYIDPPYDYADDDGFTKYQMDGFTFDDFKRLKDTCDSAINRGAFVIISNNATPNVLNLFEEDPKYKIFYDITEFSTLRTINSVASARKTGREAIFWGMNNNIPFPQANNMAKVIKLVMAGEAAIKDKERARSILEVTTTRQVAYYFSALQFFKYLTHDKRLTDEAKRVSQNEYEVKVDIYKKLMDDELFKVCYNKFKLQKSIDKNAVIEYLNKSNKGLSESTIARRASTIKSWVEWMYDVEKEFDQK